LADKRGLQGWERVPALLQRQQRLELYSKDDAGRWVLSEAAAGQNLAVDSLGVALSTDAVYRDPLAGSA
jgi:hypothetical protein